MSPNEIVVGIESFSREYGPTAFYATLIFMTVSAIMVGLSGIQGWIEEHTKADVDWARWTGALAVTILSFAYLPECGLGTFAIVLAWLYFWGMRPEGINRWSK